MQLLPLLLTVLYVLNCHGFYVFIPSVLFCLATQAEGVQANETERQEVVQGLWDASATR